MVRKRKIFNFLAHKVNGVVCLLMMWPANRFFSVFGISHHFFPPCLTDNNITRDTQTTLTHLDPVNWKKKEAPSPLAVSSGAHLFLFLFFFLNQNPIHSLGRFSQHLASFFPPHFQLWISLEVINLLAERAESEVPEGNVGQERKNRWMGKE